MNTLQQYARNELRSFGAEADARKWPRIDIGGVILPGEDAQLTWRPGAEDHSYAAFQERAGEGTRRSAARSWEGSQTQTAQAPAPSSAAHAVQCRVIEADLDELKEYHPKSVVSLSSSGFVHVGMPLTLFDSLPYRAHLLLEVPTLSRAERTSSVINPSGVRQLVMPLVPDVRAWAFWDDGIIARSHHQMPDLAICAAQPHDWMLGVHALYEYVDFCVLWLGKVLHQQFLGFWPGLQHYGRLAMRRRDRPSEYCGCGSTKRYGVCHRNTIQRMSLYDLHSEAMDGRLRYLAELRGQQRDAHPPGWQVRSIIHL